MNKYTRIFYFVLGVLSCLLCFSFYRAGYVAGCGIRSAAASTDVCVCQPCHPDRWCAKCGHFARDCPKVQEYYRRLDFARSIRDKYSQTNDSVNASTPISKRQ